MIIGWRNTRQFGRTMFEKAELSKFIRNQARSETQGAFDCRKKNTKLKVSLQVIHVKDEYMTKWDMSRISHEEIMK